MSTLREKILETIVRKSTLKQSVFDNTFSTFNELKDTLFEMASEMDDQLDGRLDRRVRIEYRDRGKFEAQLQVASDLLIFQMHTDVFEFDANHIIWQNAYVQSDTANSYCGVINVYNFLSDSFKYNRNADEGYLIGRIFINREKCFWVEGKRQTIARPMAFGQRRIDREALIEIVEAAVNYAINFDLLTAIRGEQTRDRRSVQHETRQLEVRHGQAHKLRFQHRRHLIRTRPTGGTESAERVARKLFGGEYYYLRTNRYLCIAARRAAATALPERRRGGASFACLSESSGATRRNILAFVVQRIERRFPKP